MTKVYLNDQIRKDTINSYLKWNLCVYPMLTLI